MLNNTKFKITYFSNKEKREITRHGLWTDQCKEWTSKAGNKLLTYFDLDRQAYRCAKDNWKVW